jgi:hypothetical protein
LNQLFDLVAKVKAQFLVELGLDSVASKHRPQKGKKPS